MKLLNYALFTAAAVSSTSAFIAPTVAKSIVGRSSASPGAGARNLFNKLFSSSANTGKYPIMAEEAVMSQKAHGTSEKPVMKDLRWGCDYDTADRICNFNRHYAEYAGYWQKTDFLKNLEKEEKPIQFYDSVTGKLLFTAPVGRSMEDFIKESLSHGWPSFRDQEVNWENVRCLRDGECVSVTGTHLGHNLPDGSGNRYCINLVSVAGQPQD